MTVLCFSPLNAPIPLFAVMFAPPASTLPSILSRNLVPKLQQIFETTKSCTCATILAALSNSSPFSFAISWKFIKFAKN